MKCLWHLKESEGSSPTKVTPVDTHSVYCSFPFEVEINGYDHIRQCHLASNPPYICYWSGSPSQFDTLKSEPVPCLFQTKNKFHFLDHLITHFSQNLKPFYCQYCPQTFRHRQGLRKHETLEHADMPRTRRKYSRKMTTTTPHEGSHSRDSNSHATQPLLKQNTVSPTSSHGDGSSGDEADHYRPPYAHMPRGYPMETHHQREGYPSTVNLYPKPSSQSSPMNIHPPTYPTRHTIPLPQKRRNGSEEEESSPIPQPRSFTADATKRGVKGSLSVQTSTALHPAPTRIDSAHREDKPLLSPLRGALAQRSNQNYKERASQLVPTPLHHPYTNHSCSNATLSHVLNLIEIYQWKWAHQGPHKNPSLAVLRGTVASCFEKKLSTMKQFWNHLEIPQVWYNVAQNAMTLDSRVSSMAMVEFCNWLYHSGNISFKEAERWSADYFNEKNASGQFIHSLFQTSSNKAISLFTQTPSYAKQGHSPIMERLLRHFLIGLVRENWRLFQNFVNEEDAEFVEYVPSDSKDPSCLMTTMGLKIRIPYQFGPIPIFYRKAELRHCFAVIETMARRAILEHKHVLSQHFKVSIPVDQWEQQLFVGVFIVDLDETHVLAWMRVGFLDASCTLSTSLSHCKAWALSHETL